MVSRLRCFIGGILFCFFTSSFALHATENDDLVKAMMEVYAEELAANPQDYRTYYSRAMAYFGQGDMKRLCLISTMRLNIFLEKRRSIWHRLIC